MTSWSGAAFPAWRPTRRQDSLIQAEGTSRTLQTVAPSTRPSARPPVSCLSSAHCSNRGSSGCAVLRAWVNVRDGCLSASPSKVAESKPVPRLGRGCFVAYLEARVICGRSAALRLCQMVPRILVCVYAFLGPCSLKSSGEQSGL